LNGQDQAMVSSVTVTASACFVGNLGTHKRYKTLDSASDATGCCVLP